MEILKSNLTPCLVFKGSILISEGYMNSDLLFTLTNADKQWVVTTLRDGSTVSGYLEQITINRPYISITLKLTEQEEEEYNAIQRLLDITTYWRSTVSNYTKPAKRVLELYEAISGAVDWSERHRHLVTSLTGFLDYVKRLKEQDVIPDAKLLAEIDLYSSLLDILNFNEQK